MAIGGPCDRIGICGQWLYCGESVRDDEARIFDFVFYGGTVLIGDPALATLGNMIELPFCSGSGDGGG